MDEHNIIERVQNSDQKYIAWLYKENKKKFISYVYDKFKYFREDATDFYQEAFTTACLQIKNGSLTELKCKLTTYLCSIGHKLMCNELRRIKKFTKLDQMPSISDIPEYDKMEIQKENKDKVQIVEEQVGLLSEPCKSILSMRYFKKMHYEEILPLLKSFSNIDSLKAQKYKCMQYLKKIIIEKFRTAELI